MKLIHFIKKYFCEDSGQSKREFAWIYHRIVQYKWMLLLVGLLSLVGTVMSLSSSVATKHLIDAVTGYGVEKIGMAAVLMLSLMIGSLVLQAISSRVGAAVHLKVRNRMQYNTYGRILRASWEALEPYRSGDLLNRLSGDIGTVSDGIVSFLPSLLATVIKFVGAFCIILYYDPIMALIALAGAPITMLLSRMLMRKLRHYNLAIKEMNGEVMSFQEDSFRNLTSIKAFSAMNRYENEMQKLQDEYEDVYMSFNSFQISMSSCMSLISMAVTSACFGWGVYQLWTGSITYGSMTMFLQLASTLRGSFQALVSLVQQTISITTSAGRIMAVEELPAEDAEQPEGLLEEEAINIELSNVSFQYQNGDVVLNTFDLSAVSGDQIAIIGPSGEGKTTLLRLLLGLVEPCEGKAFLKGKSGKKYKITAGTREAFAYVPQGNSVFAGTIAQNLQIVAPQASNEEMKKALQIACAWDFVSQFSEGLEHHLGAGGRGISEGQAQRLAIARALLRKAPILLLDEATSGLDVKTEKQLMKNLQESGWVRTCILVTHRPGSEEFCNRIYEIHRGDVTEVQYGE